MSSTVTETPRSGNPAAELGELLRKDFTFMRLRTELVHEAGNYLREAVALTVVVRAEGRFVEYLFACEATRHFWGRIHATGLARRVPAELEGAARRFISLVTDLSHLGQQMIQRGWAGAEKEYAEKYSQSTVSYTHLTLPTTWGV